MNALNRFFMVILVLLTLALCIIMLLRPVPVFEAVQKQAGALADAFAAGTAMPCAIALAAAILILFFVLAAELRWPRRKSVRAERAAGGQVRVSVASIADRLRHEVDRLPGVMRSKPRVLAKRRGVVVELDVETAAGLDVPQIAETVIAAVSQVVEERMGLELTRPPRVNLRVAPYAGQTGEPARPRGGRPFPSPPVAERPHVPRGFEAAEQKDVEPADASLDPPQV